MEPRKSGRRLIVNADDFGRSSSTNEAVIRAHREGILTTASLMVNGEACDEAVRMARENPALGVGLHLTLICGKSTLSHAEIPDLIDPFGNFRDSPVKTGFRYFASARLRGQLRCELRAQFDKFHATGLPLDHVNGHLNLHLHPTIFGLLRQHHREWGIRHIRLTRDPLALNRRLASGRWLYRRSHAIIFDWLSRRAEPALRQRSIRFTDRVFGLLQNALVDEAFIVKLLPLLPAGDSELYSHPSLGEFRHEFEALISPRVKEMVRDLNIRLIKYRDLDGAPAGPAPQSTGTPQAAVRPEQAFKSNRPDPRRTPRASEPPSSEPHDKTDNHPPARARLRSYRGGVPEQGLKANRRARNG